ncbi:YkgJ family cysteine cluster protein [Desulfobotulus sp.]|jgi:Fe-S-cluster containining protein|uniref:YkgJ family cysteine cluster protein n=1 Tax=Desulfobotulus sp. TaxID=1940337 RepID=UPI002A359E90|nr:YkgJ family cysteine cluster protein [Desulfobotulus sp.]MDY0162375.1 YkgJ family cysteine cluster protein [Desulfobotulus sp.]
MKNPLFDNYRALVVRVEQRLEEIRRQAGPLMVCRKGCHGCCRHITVFSVEACILAEALAGLSEDRRRVIRSRARQADADGECPLLWEGACALYAARPIICRTHGYPLVIEDEEGAFVDCCPLNFSDNMTAAVSMALALEPLNRTLVAVHALFLRESGMEGRLAARMSVAEALLLPWPLTERFA